MSDATEVRPEFHAWRETAIETLAHWLIEDPSKLRVARRRRDGSVISYRWGRGHMRADKVQARADEIKESKQSQR